MTPPPQPAVYTNAEWTKLAKWFKKLCETQQPLWDMRMAEVQAQDTNRSKEELAKRFADNAETDLQRLDNELASMQVRTSTIVAAATLMFAAFVVKSDSGEGRLAVVGATLLAVALLTTATAFIFTVRSMAPPLRRAWKDAYEKRAHWTLLVTDDYTRWVLHCWLADRRAPVVQGYKKAHSITVRLLVVASALTMPALGLVILG